MEKREEQYKCDKISFPSRGEAVEYVRVRAKGKHTPMVYFCDKCDAYHFTRSVKKRTLFIDRGREKKIIRPVDVELPSPNKKGGDVKNLTIKTNLI